MSTVKKRHQAIINLLRQEGGRLTVTKLSEQLGVSSVTIRQDLRVLADENILERTYGGAILRASSSVHSVLSFEVRQQEASREKNAIARYAAQLVKDGAGIILDGSTTAYAMVPYLKTLTNLTVVTNSLLVALGFRDTPRNKVLLPAGRVRYESGTIISALDTLPDINVNFGFFGAWGISLTSGVSDVDADEAQIRRFMLTRCLETVIMVDYRKWGEIAPYTYLELNQVSRIITDSAAPESILAECRQRGIMVDVV